MMSEVLVCRLCELLEALICLLGEFRRCWRFLYASFEGSSRCQRFTFAGLGSHVDVEGFSMPAG